MRRGLPAGLGFVLLFTARIGAKAGFFARTHGPHRPLGAGKGRGAKGEAGVHAFRQGKGRAARRQVSAFLRPASA
jgi:hypothetical protein